MESPLIFGLPVAFGLLPLLLFIILSFNPKIHPALNIIACTVLGAVLNKANLLQFGDIVRTGLSSMLALTAFTVLMGSGLAAIMRKTGAAELLVHFFIDKLGIKSEKRAILTTMVICMVMAILLATMAGANSVIAPIVIPMVAMVGITPATLSVIFMGASQIGLFCGPFVPQAVLTMELTGLGYGEYFLKVAIPIACIFFIGTYLIAVYTQKKTRGKDGETFPTEFLIEQKSYTPTPQAKRSTIAFLVTMGIMLLIGVIRGGSIGYSLTVILICDAMTGLAGGMSSYDIVATACEGAGKLFWLFITVFMFSPCIDYITNCGAFDVLSNFLSPFAAGHGIVFFTAAIVVIGIFAINGTHVAQIAILDTLFASIAMSLGVTPALWAVCLTLGSQITNFAYPGVDMIAAMGIAQCKTVKHQLRLGYMWMIPCCVVWAVIAGILIR